MLHLPDTIYTGLEQPQRGSFVLGAHSKLHVSHHKLHIACFVLRITCCILHIS